MTLAAAERPSIVVLRFYCKSFDRDNIRCYPKVASHQIKMGAWRGLNTDFEVPTGAPQGVLNAMSFCNLFIEIQAAMFERENILSDTLELAMVWSEVVLSWLIKGPKVGPLHHYQPSKADIDF